MNVFDPQYSGCSVTGANRLLPVYAVVRTARRRRHCPSQRDRPHRRHAAGLSRQLCRQSAREGRSGQPHGEGSHRAVHGRAAAESGISPTTGSSSKRPAATPVSRLAAVCAARGYDCVLTMPESMSEERRQLLSGLGADSNSHRPTARSGAIERANELADAPGTVRARQFENEANPRAHRETTGPETGPIPTATWTRSSPVSGPAARSPASRSTSGKGRRGPHFSRC